MKQEIINRLNALDPQAYEALRAVVKRYTSFENLTAENIELRKEAVKLLNTWLEEVYQLDVKPIEMDSDGADISNLFKEVR